MSQKKVTIYTDGACSGNPGPGGWGAILQYGANIREMSGFQPDTTNQRMELTAAVEALSALKEPCIVDLLSDSAYMINAFDQNWLNRWQKNGWLNAKKRPVENKDLWLELLELTKKHQVRWLKVKGHSGEEFNEKCDQLARQAIIHNMEGDGENI